ncbi:F-box/WD-40 repeat-containing protein [Artemisia annua]|uniref:F-box/WD-40 repeat-containing protein n=1 Tax=Artemisia annua TaxID=35608 RepID=A0A2U1L4C7_ARTAN|nr:F-box/WD-40 repeat-containing protein [Artemisia annua]
MAFECKTSTKIIVSKNSEDTAQVNLNHIVSSGKSLLIDSESVITESGKPRQSAKLPADECLLNDHKTVISDLPPALISEIFNCLDPKELGVVSCVSPSLYRIASDHYVWKKFYCERWGLPIAVPISLNAECSDEKSWKELFVEREYRSKTFMGRYSIDTLYGHTEPGPQNQNTEFRLWEHQGPITCVGLDLTRIYSGSWDMTIRVWDRLTLKCLNVLRHNDWVWSLVPHDSTVVSTSGSDVYVWETKSFSLVDVVKDAHVGNAYSLARSHTGSFVFTGGEDGAIHMFEIRCNSLHQVATWGPHSGPVYSLSFEFPWLVSASSDGKLSLIDVRKLLKNIQRSSAKLNRNSKNVEPPQRMLHGSVSDLIPLSPYPALVFWHHHSSTAVALPLWPLHW